MPELMRRRVLQGTVAVVFAALACGPPPAFAATINVDANADDLPNTGNCTLREAIAAAGSDSPQDTCPAGSLGADVINLPADTYTLLLGALAVSDNRVTIDGAAESTTIIDGNDAGRVFQVSGPNDPVLIRDVTIQDGLTNLGGGGIQNFGDLTLNQVTVTSNEASANLAGGINNAASGKLNVRDSSIDANVGWGIYNAGVLTLTGSSVSDNTDATGPPPDEGGIYNPGVATVEGSTISGNSDQGIYSLNTLTVADTVISDNIASTGTFGGGISILAGGSSTATTVLDRVTVTNNKALTGGGGGIASGTSAGMGASNISITDSTVAGNQADSGGGISNYADGGTMTIDRSTISGNTATNTQGGGIATSGAAILTNTTVSGNMANQNGGGIMNFGTTGPLTLSFSTVSGNTSTSGSGGIQTGGTLNMGSTIVANNTGFPGSGDDCFGSVTSQGYNLIENIDPGQCVIGGDTTTNIIGSDPGLGPLAANGGPTMTHELLTGSPAINAASPSCPPPATDQRGVTRQPGRVCDIGAFEIAEEPVPAPPAEPGDTNPPDTQITKRPKDKTKKKTAVFEFSSSEAGSTFECSLDGAQFAPCSSPDTLKVKKGKHSFEVRAKDAAGNVDGSPASDSWKVKKKKKKK